MKQQLIILAHAGELHPTKLQTQRLILGAANTHCRANTGVVAVAVALL